MKAEATAMDWSRALHTLAAGATMGDDAIKECVVVIRCASCWCLLLTMPAIS
jgi:hypothetical protein